MWNSLLYFTLEWSVFLKYNVHMNDVNINIFLVPSNSLKVNFPIGSRPYKKAFLPKLLISLDHHL